MSCQKRKAEKEEKEKCSPNASKRACYYRDSSSPKGKCPGQVSSKNLQVYSDEERKRVLEILEAEFDKELEAKEDEVIEIQERIIKAQKILQYLCYAVVSDFYSREKTITSVASTRQRRIHPAVKRLLSGKGPPGAPEVPQNVTIPADSFASSSGSQSSESLKVNDAKENEVFHHIDSLNNPESLVGKDKKVPRYIPPKPKPKPIVGNQSEPIRGGQNKVKTILLVGNVSKWLQERDDSATHKWMVYVRTPKGEPEVSTFVSKVRFFLHPSYRPNDVVQVVCPPFQLSRRGWGEFPVRVQVHFSHDLNKPVDIIHNLKLDKTQSGLQTLGSETVAEVWIHRDLPEEKTCDELQVVKIDPVEIEYSSVTPNEELNLKATNHTQSISASVKKETNEIPIDFDASENFDLEDKMVMQTPSQDESSSYQESQLSLSHQVMVSKVNIDSSINISMHPHTKVDASSLTAKESSQGEPVVSSPQGTVLPTSPSSQQTPTKQGVVNSAANLQKTQVSPVKAGTQLVKCVDSKGTVRLLQVRTDLLPKILKRGSTTIPATPPAAQEGLAKVSNSSSTVQKPLQTTLSHVQSQIHETRVLSQISDVKVVPQAIVAQTLPQNTTAKVAPLTAVTQVHKQKEKCVPQSSVLCPNMIGKAKPQSSLNDILQVDKSQRPPQTAVSQVSPLPVVGKAPTTTVGKADLIEATLTSPVKLQGAPAGMALSPGGRPFLRLFRPAGSPGTRPMLVNTANQQFIRLPASAAGNGNRPLYVLKDGKLFMMKSALDAAAINKRTSAPTKNTTISSTSIVPEKVTSTNSEPVPSTACSVLQTTRASSVDSSAMTKVISEMSPAETNSAVMVNSDVNETVITKMTDNAPSTNVDNHLLSAQNPGFTLKPRSTIAIPPVARFPAPGQVVQASNKHSLMITQRSVQPQRLVNPARITVKPGKSLLKPAVSLLKSNVAASVSASKISNLPIASENVQCPSRPTTPTVPVVTAPAPIGTVTTNKRIILGRHSGSSSITPYSQQSIFYRELLKSIIRACPKCTKGDIQRAVRWFIKNLPLINPEAKNLEFRILHPYCAPDERTFCSWNIGKQRACEWQRAKAVHSLLTDVGLDLQNIWTVRQIVLWARFHGYTPGLPFMTNSESRSSVCGGECENPIASISEYGKMSPVEEWLNQLEKISSSLSSISHPPEVMHSSDESDEEVDIVSGITSPSKVKVKQEIISIKKEDILEEMPLDPSLHPLGDLVTRSVNSIGLRLSSEEISPGVNYPVAQRMIIQAVKSLGEDLVRRAFADAWGKDNISRQPGSIETSNVCSALCHRPEFDIFTCAGLGINSISDTKTSSKK